MKKQFSPLFSMAFTTILLAIFATTIGYATFIESNAGVAAARDAVYAAKWFEILLIILSINLIGSLFKYKTWQNKKWSLLLFHVAFVIMLIGSAATRYFGFEGIMHIREGSESNTIITEKSTLKIFADQYQLSNIDIKTSNSNLINSKYFYTLNDKPISFEITNYIPSAAKLVNSDINGEPVLWISVADSSFIYKSLHLKPNEMKKQGRINYSFGENKDSDLSFILINDSIFIKSKFTVLTTELNSMKHGKLAKDSLHFVTDTLMYQIGWNSFKFKRYYPKARIDIVSMVGHDGNYPLDAITLKINYNDKITESVVFGSKDFSGEPEQIDIDGINFELSYGPELIELPFSIQLTDFILDRYINSMSPSSYKSNVILKDSNENLARNFSIYMNNILKHKGFRFFQSSYDNDERGTILSVNYDPIGTAITYFGYLLMTIGMFIAVFSRKSYFRELLTRSAKKAVVIFGFLMFSNLLMSQNNITPINNIDKTHAEKFGKLLVADPKGRIKPINTLTSEILRKIHRTSEINGLNSTQFFLSVMLDQEYWYYEKIIKVSNKDIKEKYNFNEDYISLSEVMFHKDGKFVYLFKNDVDEAYKTPNNERTKFHKEIMKLDERVNLVDMIFSGAILHIFPLKDDKNNKWLSAEDLSLPMDDTKLQQELSLLFTDYYKGLQIGVKTENYQIANETLQKLIDYQNQMGGAVIPSKTKINAEIFYNQINYFSKSALYYLIFGLILLIALFVRIFKPTKKNITIQRVLKIPIILLFVAHTLALALRWYISGHAPWSNGYETTLFIAWATLFAGVVFAKRSTISLALTAVLAAIFILISNLSWMDPEITNLVPVLKSYWLIIHVAVITSSYGFFALVFLMGLLNLIIISAQKADTKHKLNHVIEELSTIMSMSMILGVYLMTIGTFLGAVWANESWGRYWGWDPKETWALVTVIVYTIVIHLRHVPGMKNNFVVSAGGMLAFASVLMTYFGVNYFLTGMHSYAGGDAFQIPFVFKALVIAILGFVVFSGFRFYQNQQK